MLDDRNIPKATYRALLDWVIFADPHRDFTFYPEVVTKLKYRFSFTTWTLSLISHNRHREQTWRTVRNFQHWGFPSFAGVDVIDPTITNFRSYLQKAIVNFDFVYCPTILANEEFLEQVPFTLLRSPVNSQIALDVLCYFSTSPEPFTRENYYAFLRQQEAVIENLKVL